MMTRTKILLAMFAVAILGMAAAAPFVTLRKAAGTVTSGALVKFSGTTGDLTAAASAADVLSFSGALAGANNLSEIAAAGGAAQTSARSNIGLGNTATLNTAASDEYNTGEVLLASDLRLLQSNTTSNRNVATLAGTFTTSADPTAAAGKANQVLDPDAATRDVVLTAPSTTGVQSFFFTNSGTAGTDVLNFTDPTPDVTVAAGYHAIAKWNGSTWDVTTDSPTSWLADAAPLAPGTAAVGTATQGAREDHVHPYPPLVVKITSGDYTVGTTDANELYGGVIYVTGAATITVPAVASGQSFSVITIGAVAVSVDVNASDRTILDGTALADGDKITNTSTAGDIAVFTYESASGWYAATDGWTDTN